MYGGLVGDVMEVLEESYNLNPDQRWRLRNLFSSDSIILKTPDEFIAAVNSIVEGSSVRLRSGHSRRPPTHHGVQPYQIPTHQGVQPYQMPNQQGVQPYQIPNRPPTQPNGPPTQPTQQGIRFYQNPNRPRPNPIPNPGPPKEVPVPEPDASDDYAFALSLQEAEEQSLIQFTSDKRFAERIQMHDSHGDQLMQEDFSFLEEILSQSTTERNLFFMNNISDTDSKSDTNSTSSDEFFSGEEDPEGLSSIAADLLDAEEETLQTKTIGLAEPVESIMDRITVRSDSNCVCSICLDPNPDDSETYAEIECGHTFHLYCISDWISSGREKNPSCPMCRKNI